jgi:hypothetical protein
MQHGRLADLVTGMLILQIDKGQTGYVGDIGWDQRQNAGRKKREQPGNKSAEIGYFL